MRAVAKAVLEGLEDQVALDICHGAANQCARDLLGSKGGVCDCLGLARLIELGAVRGENRVGPDLSAGSQ